MQEETQLMPSYDALCNVLFTPKQWLLFYLNIWKRNLMATMTDIARDGAEDPTASTGENKKDAFGQALMDPKTQQPMFVTFGERKRDRQAQAQRSIKIIAAIESLYNMEDAEIEKMMQPDSDFLKAVAPEAPAPAAAPAPEAPAAPAQPAAEQTSPLKSYTVQPDKIITIDGKNYDAGQTVMLDPADQQTIDFLGNAVIKLTDAPAT